MFYKKVKKINFSSFKPKVAQVAVPLLLHAVTLPGGADVLWCTSFKFFHRRRQYKTNKLQRLSLTRIFALFCKE